MATFMNKFFLFSIIFLVSSFSSGAQVKIIFDTDFGGDADDLGALVMLHNLMAHGECELLAVMSWSTEKYTVPAIDAVNRYYNHPDVPIGVRKDGESVTDWNYGKAIAEKLEYKLDYHSAPETTELYRKILSSSEGQSIVIVTVGPLKNIQNLINSKPDEYSSLDGRELLKNKVKEFSIMGGQFPEGKNEWNFNGNMPGVTKYVLENLDVPIAFSGFEVGVAIKTGAVFNSIDENSLLYLGFKHFSEHAPWMKQYFKGNILDNSTFDQTSVLYAVRGGVGKYWERVAGGYCLADENGGNQWIAKENSNHSYLKLMDNESELEELLEAMMLNNFK